MVRPWPHWGACVALGRAIDIWLSLTDVSPEVRRGSDDRKWDHLSRWFFVGIRGPSLRFTPKALTREEVSRVGSGADLLTERPSNKPTDHLYSLGGSAASSSLVKIPMRCVSE